MAKKLGPPIFLGVFTVLAIVFLTGGASDDKEILHQTFDAEAIYYDDARYVEISYRDNSQKTTQVVMEILGMDESFQRTFTDSEFVEIVPFEVIPKYGWEVHPIVLEIDHEELGHIQLKTEIHPQGESVPPTIYAVTAP